MGSLSERSMPAGRKASSLASLTAILLLVVLAAGCSVPNLETPACVESKNKLREFYSYHFGNEMAFTAEGFEARERFLTPEFAQVVKGSSAGTDPFTTGSEDIPRAFRIAECREITVERTETNVLLFWRTDDRTEQRQITVETVDRNDTWLVSRITR